MCDDISEGVELPRSLIEPAYSHMIENVIHVILRFLDDVTILSEDAIHRKTHTILPSGRR